jgi:hypothetical protein
MAAEAARLVNPTFPLSNKEKKVSTKAPMALAARLRLPTTKLSNL